MIVSISAALLLGAAVFVLCKWAGCKAWHALVCVLCGFALASSPAAPFVGYIMSSLLGLF